MECYNAFGLSIGSELPLYELGPALGKVDLEVRIGASDYPLSPIGFRFAGTEREARFGWGGVGGFIVRGGREIVVEPAGGSDPALLRLLLLGSAMAVLLHQRGHLTLHASAAGIGGGAVVFVGACGSGKSTLAGAIHAAGHTLLADDLVALDLKSEGLRVLPSFPLMRLWPDAVAELGEDPERLRRVDPQFDKRFRPVTERFQETPLPLRCVYVLSPGEELRIEPLAPQEGFVELLRHSYLARIIPELGAREHFLQCAELVRSVPVRRILRDTGKVRPSDVAKAVEEDLRGLQC
jgi:hypothetical protein